jgi:radical SAM superfamily enzyme YgiQ (UPF0313 family)
MLVRPPSGYGTGNKPNIKEGLYLLPQALPYLARVIENCGFEPIVVDLEVLGWTLKAFLRFFSETSPDVVLFTVTTPSYCYCREMAGAIRQITNEVPIIFGGPHATYTWYDILNDRVADVVVLREGEFTLGELLECLVQHRTLDQCAGIAFRDPAGFPRLTRDIPRPDPFAVVGIPAYEYLDMRAYRDRVGKCTLEVSRGCPRGCKFCLNTKFYPRQRFKPIAAVMEELEVLVGRYHFDKISIISPEFVIRDTYTSDLMDAFTIALGQSNVTWACASSAMSLSPRVLAQMSKAHCRSIFVGIESGAAEVQSAFGDKLQLATLDEKLCTIGDAGMNVLASFILGLPGETEASANRTIDLALTFREKHKFIKTIQFNTFGPFPGTDFATDAERYNCRSLPIDGAYYAVVPAIESDLFPQELHTRLWHRVWQEFFPAYFDEYLRIEAAAFSGTNPRLSAFCTE